MAERLPEAAWTRRADLAALIAALGPGQARYVGGAVRDALLGHEADDVDVATPLPPPEVIARLEAAGLRAIPTGIAHGTVTAALDHGPVEITTLRRDIATDGRRAIVAFSDDWWEDAARRDFSINALYADPASRQLFDWFGGLADLAARRVRFIGDPRQRIGEDHLRILRYFRFQARFGAGEPDTAAESACAELAATLKGLSRERVGMEMLKLLALPDPARAVARMATLGVLTTILPEADAAPLAALVTAERMAGVPPDAVRRLAALLPAEPGTADRVAARFRLSGTQRNRLTSAAGRDGGHDDPRALAYRIGHEEALDRLLLAGADPAPLANWRPQPFPLKGGEIVARGVSAGPEVARILRRVEERWIAEGFPARERVLAILSAELGDAGS